MSRIARLLAPATALLALALAAPTGASVQVGAAGWQWGNPLPQGNTIRSLAFAGGSGYAVGDFGTVLATDDGGATWRGLISGTLENLREVQAIDQNSLFAGGGCVGRRSDDGGKTFTRVAFTPVEFNCRQPLAAAWFATEQIGYIVLADGTTIRTDNNGLSFASRTPIPGTGAAGGSAKPTDIVFTGADSGLAATSGGKVYRTTDGANTWTLVADYGRTVQAFALAGTSVIAAGDQGLLRSSNDGGVTWTGVDKASIGNVNLSGVSCASADLCVLRTATGNGQPGNDLIRYDAALTPSTSQVTPSGSPIAAAAFAAPARVVAAGTAGVTAVSADAGKTFTPVGTALTGSFSGVVAGAARTAFAYGDNGAIAKTVNGGLAWTPASVPTSEALNGVSFPTPGAGFALDAAGGLFATADGGATWRTLDIGTTSSPRSVLAPSPTTVLVAGPRVRRSVDGGASFTAATGAIAKRSVASLDAAGSALLAWGGDSLWRTTDRGRSWKAVKHPVRTVRLRRGKTFNAFFIDQVDFLTAKLGYLEGDGGRLFRTANGGASWTELFSAGSANISDVVFGTSSKGYLVSRAGRGPSTILRTTDSGATWAPQVVVRDPVGRDGLSAGSDGTDYLLAGAKNLLFTTTGGTAGKPSALSISTRTTKLKKAAPITVTGKLVPAQAGRVVTVSFLPAGQRRWQSATAKTASTGTFTTSFRVRKGTNRFVAQWPGDELRSGDGTGVLTVTASK